MLDRVRHTTVSRRIHSATLCNMTSFRLGRFTSETARHDSVRVNQAGLTMEHYFSAFSWAITRQPVRSYGTTVNSGQDGGSYRYGNKNSGTLMTPTGGETTATGRNVIITPRPASAQFGRYWVNSRWALKYHISHTRQGNLHSMSNFNLAVQHSH